jgi:intein/homing endonuclease
MSKQWNYEEKKILIQHFKNSEREVIISLLPGRTWSAIEQHARTMKLNRKPLEQKKFETLCVDFSEIKDEKHAYLLGYIAADGNIYRNHVNISVSEKDHDYIDLLRKWFGESSPVKYRVVTGGKYKGTRWYGQYYFTISSKLLVKQLFVHNLVPNKTKILLPPPHVPDDLIRHWVRGYFDGDGSLYLSRSGYVCFSVLGTEKILQFILFHFNRIKDTNFNTSYNRTIRQLATCGKNAIIFLDWLYVDCNYYLPRKYSNYLNIRNKNSSN